MTELEAKYLGKRVQLFGVVDDVVEPNSDPDVLGVLVDGEHIYVDPFAVTVEEWLDQPTGEGWWAWQGHFSAFPDRKCQEICRVSEVSDGSLIAHGINIIWPVEYMIGQWKNVEIDWLTNQ